MRLYILLIFCICHVALLAQPGSLIGGFNPDTVTIKAGKLFPASTGLFSLMKASGFPNPTSASYTVQVALEQEDQIQIQLFDVYGNRQYEYQSSSPSKNHNQTIDFSGLAIGYYTLRIVSSTDVQLLRIEKL
ncbi:MAG: T9SS type A sorting domain-containing protein [Cytophagaceae bacterium]|jgi:hypothetical protein|nr:T9SS type A sorting domain-containing protein [Cytophagaceae bacterium]